MKIRLILGLILISLVVIGALVYILINNNSSILPKTSIDIDNETAAEECEAEGGNLIACFTTTGYACSLLTEDGGKVCSDNDECEAECVAPENCEPGTESRGKCADRTYLICGGVSIVEDGMCKGILIT